MTCRPAGRKEKRHRSRADTIDVGAIVDAAVEFERQAQEAVRKAAECMASGGERNC